MPIKNNYPDREKVISEWFKDHEVSNYETLLPSPGTGQVIEVLTWKKPGTSIYRIDYTRRSNYLIVTGDVGDAIYSWSEPVYIRWISELDLHYFASKCVASEYGRQYKEWNRELAKEWLTDYFLDVTEEEDEVRLAKEKQKSEELYIWESLYSEIEWIAWMMANGHDVFGDDLEGFENIGNEIAMRCQAHLLGLRMAFEKIDGVTNAKEKG